VQVILTFRCFCKKKCKNHYAAPFLPKACENHQFFFSAQRQAQVGTAKEAKARIKINKLLEESGWQFFDDATGKANIVLEPKVKLTKAVIDALGDNFEESSSGFIDLLLLDESGFPLVVLEAKIKAVIGRVWSASDQSAGTEVEYG